MPKSSESSRNERPNTYFVQDRRNKEEFTRVTVQDQMLTSAMGGILPEQADPTMFRRVLDVGCATGGWAIEAARRYPTMSVVGIDISEKMIEYARARAHAEQLADRVSFHVMDALRPLKFPSASFDLVNQRLGGSFIRTWEWPELISEFQRVSRPGGVIRLTEAEIAENDCSPALTRLHQMLRQTFYNAGNFFRLQNDGLTGELAAMLTRYGLQDVQTCLHSLVYRAGTPGGQHFAEDMQYLYRTVRPFMQRWIRLPDDYDAIYRQALVEMRHPDFVAYWRFLTVWGSVKAD